MLCSENGHLGVEMLSEMLPEREVEREAGEAGLAEEVVAAFWLMVQ